MTNNNNKKKVVILIVVLVLFVLTVSGFNFSNLLFNIIGLAGTVTNCITTGSSGITLYGITRSAQGAYSWAPAGKTNSILNISPNSNLTINLQSFETGYVCAYPFYFISKLPNLFSAPVAPTTEESNFNTPGLLNPTVITTSGVTTGTQPQWGNLSDTDSLCPSGIDGITAIFGTGNIPTKFNLKVPESQ